MPLKLSDDAFIEIAAASAPRESDDYTVRSVVKLGGDRAGRAVLLSTGGRVGEGFIAILTENGRIASSRVTRSAREIRVTPLLLGDRAESCLLLREVSKSGTGWHGETVTLLDLDQVSRVLFEREVIEYVEGPWPMTRVTERQLMMGRGCIHEIETVKTGNYSEDTDDIAWDEPRRTLTVYDFDEATGRFGDPIVRNDLLLYGGRE